MRVLNQAFDYPARSEEHASTILAGGIMQHGYQCGMLWGATLAAGAEACRRFGPGAKAQAAAVGAAQRLIASFRGMNDAINCVDITELDKSSSKMEMITYFLIKGGTIGCFKMAARYAPVAYAEIHAALSEEHPETPQPPVSCAAVLAKKAGLSDEQTTMAAGLAGGIGLSGGACGALGAAVWILGLKSDDSQKVKLDFNDPGVSRLIEKFLKTSGYEFECAEIVSRKFENVGDHATHLCEGGCAEIIDSLATGLPGEKV